MSSLRLSRLSLGLLLISAGTLAFEISLTRLFAVQQFHHFAFVVVSLAVMGFAPSGLLLWYRRRQPSLAALAAAFSAAVLAAYLIMNLLPFDSYSIAWDRRQVGILLLYFLAASAPFVFTGWVVASALQQAGQEARRPYAANLAGSAMGCLLALGAMPLIGAEGSTMLSASLGSLAALAFSGQKLGQSGAQQKGELEIQGGEADAPGKATSETSRLGRIALVVAAAIMFALALRMPEPLRLQLSAYKPLSTTQLLPDAELSLTRWSSASRVDVVDSASIHIFPGLSLNASIELPRQSALFIDGDGPIPITNARADDPQMRELASRLPSFLPFLLREEARTLILLPGAGQDALVALAGGASSVSLVQDEPLVYEVLQGPYASFSGGLLSHPRVRLLDRPGRGALRAPGEPFDVVLLSLSEPFRPVAMGAYSLTEYYPVTVQALSDAYERLSPGGLLVITRWLGTPPSESARAWSTLLAALDRSGVESPSQQLLAYRSMRTATMIAARRPFTRFELERTRAFLRSNGFDPIWLPDLQPGELNQYNRLPQDVYHSLYADLLEDPDRTYREYDFNLQPPTDERPYFFHYFRWRQTPEVLAGLGFQWLPFGGSGYLVLLVLLGVIATLALAIVVAPALWPRAVDQRSRLTGASLAYFACLGAGYLLVEIPLFQRLSLLLDRPALALGIVLFTLLMASGIGSLGSSGLPTRPALVALVGILALSLYVLPRVVSLALPWPLLPRALLAVLAIAPAGLLMGVPFAAGLRQLERSQPGLIPWAWAINGAVSGISGVLAAMISLDWGFSATLGIGALAYAGAWLCYPSIGARKARVPPGSVAQSARLPD